MTNDEFSSYVRNVVNDTIKRNSEAINHDIVKGVSENDPPEAFTATMIANSMNIAAQVATQVTFAILEHLKVMNVDDYSLHPEEPSLSLVWDSSKHVDK